MVTSALRCVMSLGACIYAIDRLDSGHGVTDLLIAAMYAALAIGLMAANRQRQVWARHAGWYVVDALVTLLLLRNHVAIFPGVAAWFVIPVACMAAQAGPKPAVLLAAASLVGAVGLHPDVANAHNMAWDQWLYFALAAAVIAVSIPLVRWATRPVRAEAIADDLLGRLRQDLSDRKGLAETVHGALMRSSQVHAFEQADVLIQGVQLCGFHWHATRGLTRLQGEDLTRLRDRCEQVRHAVTVSREQHDVGTQAWEHRAEGEQLRLADISSWIWVTPKGNGTLLKLSALAGSEGCLWLRGSPQAFDEETLHWLRRSWSQILPMLENAELLEQIHHHMTLAERARIGRDLHDSAVQPYVGLKFGLEALARQVGPDNPAHAGLQRLIDAAQAELQSLRDMITGLRRGDEVPMDTSSLVDLETQSRRLESLFGLRVAIFAPKAQRIRGALAGHVLHFINEGLSNAKRHAQATTATVLVDVDDDSVSVRIRNDVGLGGRSYVVDGAEGPRSIKDRALSLGANLSVHHEDGMTELCIDIPASAGQATSGAEGSAATTPDLPTGQQRAA
jgi:signal transduction histidine kinase